MFAIIILIVLAFIAYVLLAVYAVNNTAADEAEATDLVLVNHSNNFSVIIMVCNLLCGNTKTADFIGEARERLVSMFKLGIPP